MKKYSGLLSNEIISTIGEDPTEIPVDSLKKLWEKSTFRPTHRFVSPFEIESNIWGEKKDEL